MLKIILISHGGLCNGLLDSLKMVAGDDFGVQTASLLPGMTPESFRKKLKEKLEIIPKENNILVLSDIAGGTPYQSAVYLAKDFNFGLVSGMNLPMLLSLVFEYESKKTISELVAKHSSPEHCGIKGEDFKKGGKKQRAKLSINKN
ncbi:MAG: PTS sugar transporter subunit IIA [Breznakia sp.]